MRSSIFKALRELYDSPSGYLRLAVAIAVLAAVSYRMFLLLSEIWQFTTDDAYITLRYADNLHRGQGLTWNPGEPPVEGYSNFLTVLLSALAFGLGADPETTIKWLNGASLFATFFTLYHLSRLWVGPVMSTVPALVLSTYFGTVLWTASGLETASFQLFCVLAVLFAFRGAGFEPVEPDGRRKPPRRGPPATSFVVLSAIAALLAALSRPEGILAGAIIFAFFALGSFKSKWLGSGQPTVPPQRSMRVIVLFGAILAVAYGAYLLWHYAYFESLFPNTVACKATSRTIAGQPRWTLNSDYCKLAAPYLFVGLLYPLRRLDLRHMVLWTFPAAYLIMMYGADGVVAHYCRHFLAAHGFVLILAVVAADRLLRFTLSSLSPYRDLIFVAFAFVFTWNLRAESVVQTEAQLSRYLPRAKAREKLATFLESRLKPGDTVVLGDCGLVGYRTRLRIIDAFCLNSREFTSAPIHLDNLKFIDWIYDQSPDALVVHSNSVNTLRPRESYGFYPELVSHPDFERHYRYAARFGNKGSKFNYWVYLRVNEDSK